MNLVKLVYILAYSFFVIHKFLTQFFNKIYSFFDNFMNYIEVFPNKPCVEAGYKWHGRIEIDDGDLITNNDLSSS